MNDFTISLLAGANAGFACDVCLFPLDTIKSRLQAPEGFLKAGGFRGVYQGLSATAVGSAPSAAMFFGTYEFCKKRLGQHDQLPPFMAHMISASLGEFMACVVRVPSEVIKLNMQTGRYSTAVSGVKTLLETEGPRGLYRGFLTTLLREIPFAAVQLPLLEQMKVSWARHRGVQECNPLETAVCGTISGAFAGAITTPLDVAKTRLMLGCDLQGVPYRGTVDALVRLYYEGGVTPAVAPSGAAAVAGAGAETCASAGATVVAASAAATVGVGAGHGAPPTPPRRTGGFRVLFSGVGPRVAWLGIGGFFFFGVYDVSKQVLNKFKGSEGQRA